MKQEVIDWQSTKIIAQVWNCGDEICDCNHGVIERITPNESSGYPWIKREMIYDGIFHSNGEGYNEIEKDLKEAVDRFRSDGFAVEDIHQYIF